MENYLQEVIEWIQAQPEILAAYLYGSQLEGQATALSDVDVGLLVKPELSKSQLWRLEDRWLAQWPESVDLRLLNLAPLSFQYQVTARGQRLWAADVDTVAWIESLIWRRYWDLHPKLEQDWAHFVEHLMEQQNETERHQYQTALAKVRAVHQRVREAAAPYARGVQE